MSVYGSLLKEFPVLGVHALFAWKFGALFLYDLVSGSLFLGILVLLVEYRTLDSSGDDFVRGACLVRQWIRGLRQYLALDEFDTISTFTWTRILERSFFIRFEWRIVLSRCFSSLSLGALLALGTLETLFMASSWLICVGVGVKCTGTGPCIISLSDFHRRGAFVIIRIPSR